MKIKEEQLKIIQDQQEKLNELIHNIGLLESQKHGLLHEIAKVNVDEIAFLGAKTFLANGFINDCGRIVGEGKDQMNWFDTSTLKEPYRIEGKKTMGLELAEQLDWNMP